MLPFKNFEEFRSWLDWYSQISFDLRSHFRSIWLGPLLTTWETRNLLESFSVSFYSWREEVWNG